VDYTGPLVPVTLRAASAERSLQYGARSRSISAYRTGYSNSCKTGRLLTWRTRPSYTRIGGGPGPSYVGELLVRYGKMRERRSRRKRESERKDDVTVVEATAHKRYSTSIGKPKY
jgi:hypothetical protein